MKRIYINLNNIPDEIGELQENRRDYKKTDLNDILDWVDEQLTASNLMCVLIGGKAPTWLYMSIQYHLRDIEALGYMTGQMPEPYMVWGE